MKTNKFFVVSLLISTLLISAVIWYAINSYTLFQFSDPVTLIHKNCLKKMNDKTCTIFNGGPDLQSLPSNAETVLIAGFGSINATDYRLMMRNPYEMCESIKSSCTSSQSNELCKLGQFMYLEK